jgi:hypothetical protein
MSKVLHATKMGYMVVWLQRYIGGGGGEKGRESSEPLSFRYLARPEQAFFPGFV